MGLGGRPVGDIATLRTICHAEKIAQNSSPWYVLQRRVSIYLTWLLLHTGLKPNQVTLISVGLALLGGILLATRSAELALVGALAFVAHQLFDKADGDIARFRKTYSIVGVYLDELGHAVAFAGIFVGLGLHIAWRTPGGEALVAVLLTSTLGALAMVLSRQHKSVGFLLYAQNVLTQPELIPRSRAGGWRSALTRDAVHHSRSVGATRDLIVRMGDVALQLSDFSVLVMLVLVGTILEVATGSDALLRGVLFGEAALQGVVFGTVVVVNATANVESEVARLDALVKGRDNLEASR
jgi:phosphatidylglycerophosphate synthase